MFMWIHDGNIMLWWLHFCHHRSMVSHLAVIIKIKKIYLFIDKLEISCENDFDLLYAKGWGRKWFAKFAFLANFSVGLLHVILQLKICQDHNQSWSKDSLFESKYTFDQTYQVSMMKLKFHIKFQFNQLRNKCST